MKKDKNIPSLVGLALLALTIIYISYTTTFGEFGNLGYLVGYAFGVGALAYIILRALLRNNAKKYSLLISCLLASGMVLKEEYPEMMAARDMQAFIFDVKKSNDVPEAINTSQTKVAAALRILLKTAEETNVKFDGIFSEYESSFYSNLLAPKNITNPAFIQLALQKIKEDRASFENKASQITKIYENEIFKIDNQLKQFMSKNNNLDKSYIENYKNGYNKTRKSDLKAYQTKIDIVSNMYNEITNLFKFFSELDYKMEISKNGTLLFKTNEDANIYNVHLAVIKNLNLQEDELIANYTDEVKNRGINFNKLIK